MFIRCTYLLLYLHCSFIQPEGEDDLKKRQLMELAILNGTYRDTKSSSTSTAAPTGVTPTIARKSVVCGGHMSSRLLNDIYTHLYLLNCDIVILPKPECFPIFIKSKFQSYFLTPVWLNLFLFVFNFVSFYEKKKTSAQHNLFGFFTSMINHRPPKSHFKLILVQILCNLESQNKMIKKKWLSSEIRIVKIAWFEAVLYVLTCLFWITLAWTPTYLYNVHTVLWGHGQLGLNLMLQNKTQSGRSQSWLCPLSQLENYGSNYKHYCLDLILLTAVCSVPSLWLWRVTTFNKKNMSSLFFLSKHIIFHFSFFVLSECCNQSLRVIRPSKIFLFDKSQNELLISLKKYVY